MKDYTPQEVKYRIAVTNSEVGEMALTYIHELEQINFQLRGENKQLRVDYQDNKIENEKLRKENTELKQINSETLAQLNYDNGELIVENEKLRKELSESNLKLEALDDNIPWAEIKDKSEVIGKLTEAKEIMKELLDALKNENSDYTFALKSSHSVLISAEQFLKDNEIEK